MRPVGGDPSVVGLLLTIRIAAQLPTLEVPARVVWGTGDQFEKVAYGERLASDLRTDLRRIEGAKHWTPEDHPHTIARR